MKLECKGGLVFCVSVPVATAVAFILAFSGLWILWRRYGRKHRALYEAKVTELVDLPLVFCVDPDLLPPSKAWEVEYSADLASTTVGQANMIFNRDGTVLGSGTHQNREYVIYGKFDSETSIVNWVEVERGALRQENTYDIQGLLLDNEKFLFYAGRRDPLIRMCAAKLQQITDRTLVCRNILEGYFWSSHGGSGTIALRTEKSTSEVPKGDIVLNMTDIPYVTPMECHPNDLPSSPLKKLTNHSGFLLLGAPACPSPVAGVVNGEGMVEGQLMMDEEELEAAGTGLSEEETTGDADVDGEKLNNTELSEEATVAHADADGEKLNNTENVLDEDDKQDETVGSQSRSETWAVKWDGGEDESESAKDSQNVKPGPEEATLDSVSLHAELESGDSTSTNTQEITTASNFRVKMNGASGLAPVDEDRPQRPERRRSLIAEGYHRARRNSLLAQEQEAMDTTTGRSALEPSFRRFSAVADPRAPAALASLAPVSAILNATRAK